MKSDKNILISGFLDNAIRLAQSAEADALMILPELPLDWKLLKEKAGDLPLIAVAEDPETLAGAKECEIGTIILDIDAAPKSEKLTQGLLESVANELLPAGASVIAVYSAYEESTIDSISFIRMHEHLGRLTVRDLQRLETKVPLDTLKTVIDLAIDIGREGREGKPVGTMFVVGDHRKVLEQSHAGNFDLVKGYTRKERSLFNSRVREGVKELALMDGAFVVAADATIEGTSRIIDTAPVQLTMTTGLGSRHWAGAAISKNTKAIAVVVSESNGTVRIFQDGQVVLRIVPFRRAMKFKDLDIETPADQATK